MPISSGAGGRRARVVAPANKRATASLHNNNKRVTNLKRSPNWPGGDVTQSSPALVASPAGVSCSSSEFNQTEKQNKDKSAKTLRRSSPQQQQQSISVISKQEVLRKVHERAANSEQVAINQAEAAPSTTNRLRQLLMSSLGGQRAVTGDQQQVSSLAIDSSAKTMKSNKQPSLFTAFMVGGSPIDTRPSGDSQQATTSDYKKPRMLGGKTYLIGANGTTTTTAMTGGSSAYHLSGQQSTHSLAPSTKSSLQNSQASLLNPSMSLLSGGGVAGNQTNSSGGSGGGAAVAASASNSLANLHNLHNHHNHHLHKHKHTHHKQHEQLSASSAPQLPTSQRARLNISKRVNLKYVKSLIILLMSLDLLITIFVHHFASNDQLAIAFTSHKLRFSMLNLVLSSIWFIVLAGAIIFDVYPILLIGCLVDFASFILLLVCSVIHFTHRIDYNTVNLTSLLLLLFSIIVLHVYLLVIAALTTYLMLAVKRRRMIQS